MRADDEAVKAFADEMYEKLQAEGLEVVYDDRVASAGVKFSDADLLGVPFRVIVSPRNLQEDCCEIASRDKSINQKVKTTDVITTLLEMLS